MHDSVISIIAKPEFINLQPSDISPLMASCEIKVLYVGQNRNRSYISKEVAIEMSKTLRGCPIVGWYKEEKQDFADHGDVTVIDDTGIHVKSMTRPYGFVSPDAKVWFQKFVETDAFGNEVEREYLMTTGWLWVKQYPEIAEAADKGKPHSMELDKDSLEGKWAEDYNLGMEFFIIDDAEFSKLCVLGDDVEPCFEGSKVSAPEVSKNFTKTVYNMMQELKFALGGGTQTMEENLQTPVVEETTPAVETEETPAATEEEKNFSADEDKSVEDALVENQNTTEEEIPSNSFKKDDEKENDESDNKDDESNKDANEPESKEEDDEDKKKYSLLEEKYTALEAKYAALEAERNELFSFKQKVDKKEKEDLINSFYMLSEEDKKDVVTNIDKYSKDDIEAKLSVICVRNKVSFALDEEDTASTEGVTTYSLNEVEESIPAWIAAARAHKE